MIKDKKKTWISEDKSQKYIGEFDFDGKKTWRRNVYLGRNR